MATDGPSTPPPCDREIFQKGIPVAALKGSSYAVERWVREMAEMAMTRVDWHYSGGVAQVLFLGDPDGQQHTVRVMRLLEHKLEGRVLRYFEPEDQSLYRNGVTEVPEGTIAAYYEGGPGSTYLVDLPHHEGAD